jgi:hypothetical protein
MPSIMTTEPRRVPDLDPDSVFIQENRESLRLTIGRQTQGDRHTELTFAEARILAYELLASAQRAEYELQAQKNLETLKNSIRINQ